MALCRQVEIQRGRFLGIWTKTAGEMERLAARWSASEESALNASRSLASASFRAVVSLPTRPPLELALPRALLARCGNLLLQLRNCGFTPTRGGHDSGGAAAEARPREGAEGQPKQEAGRDGGQNIQNNRSFKRNRAGIRHLDGD